MIIGDVVINDNLDQDWLRIARPGWKSEIAASHSLASIRWVHGR